MGEAAFVLLVIYRKNGAQSAACESLRRAGNRQVLMADNSEEDLGNDLYCRQAGWQYLRMPGNAGLSRAYNAGIAALKGRADWVILLDDDTALDDTYFSALQAARQRQPQASIFLPRVTDRYGPLSPCRIGRFTTHRADDPATIPPNQLTGINSGMAIDMAVFDSYTYDERYFLDFVDHAFLRDMRAAGRTVGLLDVELTQRFSGSDRSNPQKARRRYKTFKKDCRIFCGPSWQGRLYYPVAVTRRRLGLLRQLYRPRKPKSTKGA